MKEQEVITMRLSYDESELIHAIRNYDKATSTVIQNYSSTLNSSLTTSCASPIKS